MARGNYVKIKKGTSERRLKIIYDFQSAPVHSVDGLKQKERAGGCESILPIMMNSVACYCQFFKLKNILDAFLGSD